MIFFMVRLRNETLNELLRRCPGITPKNPKIDLEQDPKSAKELSITVSLSVISGDLVLLRSLSLVGIKSVLESKASIKSSSSVGNIVMSLSLSIGSG